MKSVRFRLKFLKSPLKYTFCFSAILSLIPTIGALYRAPGLILWIYPISLAFLIYPLILTADNLALLFLRRPSFLCRCAKGKVETVTLLYGAFCTALLAGFSSSWKPWSEQLYNSDLHAPIDPDKIWVVILLCAFALIGFLILRFLPPEKQPPLLTVVCLALLYIGGAIMVLWCIQIIPNLIKGSLICVYLLLLPFNYLVIMAQIILDLIRKRKTQTLRFGRLSRFLNHSASIPVLGVLMAVPILGILTLFLVLFGQEPDYLIQVWTNTADWTMSKQIPPQNIEMDMHYLCTVAAGGHRKVVKPLRTGIRHGHRVVVNRQLCIANAFEQLLEERTPRFHRAVRGFYDRHGYPIAKHIRSKVTADIIYFLMKPLEWCFLFVLYLFDPAPENRIAVQYPHSEVPKC